jgi:uncharacterized protein with von Willebrand factor type A (vWA) domain
MQQKVVEFTNLLRKSGIRVSVAESITAFEALDELSIDDRELFKDTLRTTMVKRGDEIATFDQLFDLYWSGFYDSLRESFGSVGDQMASMDIDMDALLQQITEMLAQMDGDLDLSELAKALLTQDLSQLENMIRDAAQEAGTGNIENMLQVGFFSRRTVEGMGMEGAGRELENLAQMLEEAGMSPEDRKSTRLNSSH